MASPTQNISDIKADPENLYHICFITSYIQKDPNGEIEKIRIPGTYCSLGRLKLLRTPAYLMPVTSESGSPNMRTILAP